jgi:hypothetical protein
MNSRTGSADSPRHLDRQTGSSTLASKRTAIKVSVKHIMPGKKSHNSTILPVTAASRPLNTNVSASIYDGISTFDKRFPNQVKLINMFLVCVVATKVVSAGLLGSLANGTGQ